MLETQQKQNLYWAFIGQLVITLLAKTVTQRTRLQILNTESSKRLINPPARHPTLTHTIFLLCWNKQTAMNDVCSSMTHMKLSHPVCLGWLNIFLVHTKTLRHVRHHQKPSVHLLQGKHCNRRLSFTSNELHKWTKCLFLLAFFTD